MNLCIDKDFLFVLSCVGTHGPQHMNEIWNIYIYIYIFLLFQQMTSHCSLIEMCVIEMKYTQVFKTWDF